MPNIKDINDDGQTVLITERIIKIHTTATDKNGKKEIEAGKDVTIVDKVTLDRAGSWNKIQTFRLADVKRGKCRTSD